MDTCVKAYYLTYEIATRIHHHIIRKLYVAIYKNTDKKISQ